MAKLVVFVVAAALVVGLQIFARRWSVSALVAPPSIPRIWLVKDLRGPILKHRHPWLFDRALRGQADCAPGGVVAVAWKKETLAYGFYDPDSPLRVRLLSWDREPDITWTKEVAAAAAERRRADTALAGCRSLRLLHGEADFTPGLVLDLYEGVGVATFDGSACEAFWRPRLAVVLGAFVAAGFAIRSVVSKKGEEVLWGEALPDEAGVINEYGARFELDVRRGHKTGFFLDQRENRYQLRKLAAGKDVLDLFSYTGGFAVSAALGGARQTTAVDQAAPACDACQRNYALNGLEAHLEIFEGTDVVGAAVSGSSTLEAAATATPLRDKHRVVVGDVFEFLEAAARRGESYDIVVNDPPSMAPSARLKSRALKAYTKLNTLALGVLRPGGLLITCSCSSHVTGAELREAVEEAGQRAGRSLRLEAARGAGSDHPVRKGFVEGDYLQALYMRTALYEL